VTGVVVGAERDPANRPGWIPIEFGTTDKIDKHT